MINTSNILTHHYTRHKFQVLTNFFVNWCMMILLVVVTVCGDDELNWIEGWEIICREQNLVEISSIRGDQEQGHVWSRAHHARHARVRQGTPSPHPSLSFLQHWGRLEPYPTNLPSPCDLSPCPPQRCVRQAAPLPRLQQHLHYHGIYVKRVVSSIH